jgi:hypothetical protein
MQPLALALLGRMARLDLLAGIPQRQQIVAMLRRPLDINRALDHCFARLVNVGFAPNIELSTAIAKFPLGGSFASNRGHDMAGLCDTSRVQIGLLTTH